MKSSWLPEKSLSPMAVSTKSFGVLISLVSKKKKKKSLVSFLTTNLEQVSPVVTKPSDSHSVNTTPYKAWNFLKAFLVILMTKPCYWFMDERHGMNILQFEKLVPLRKN